MILGSFWDISLYGKCDDNANVAGQEIPKCVKSIGQETRASSAQSVALGRLMPEHFLSRSSSTKKLFNDGPIGVMVCHSDCASAYQSPVEPVFPYAFHHVVITTKSKS